MKKIIFVGVAGALLIAGSIFAIAQRSGQKEIGHFGGRGGHGGPAMFLRGLDLNDDQKAKVKEIMKASKANIEPLMKQIRENRQKAAGLGTDGKFDQSQVEAAAAEQGNLVAKLIVEKEKAKAEIFAILSDEQRAKAIEIRGKAQDRFKMGHGFRGREPAGMEF